MAKQPKAEDQEKEEDKTENTSFDNQGDSVLNTLNQESVMNTLNEELTVHTTKPAATGNREDVAVWQSKNKVAPYMHTMIMVSQGWTKGKEVTESEYMSAMSGLRSVKNGK